MPFIIAALRQLIMTAIQVGAWFGVEKAISSVLDASDKANKENLGLDDDDAKAHTANTFLDVAIASGVTFAMLRSKLPAKIADRLGFTTKGFQKRQLSPAGKAKVSGKKEPTQAATKKSRADIDQLASTVAKTKGVNLLKVGALLFFIDQLIALPTRIFQTAAQYIDYANWEGPYQGTFQKILSKVGFEPDKPMPKASAVSDEVWKKIYTVIEELNPKGVLFPFSGETRPYSRANLADLVNEIAANIIKDRGDATFKNVMGIALPLIQLGEKATTPKTTTTVSTPAISSGANTLSGYYSSIGKSLPSIAERAKIYEQMGLGQAAFYTGTAEQNTKLLNALKGKMPSSAVVSAPPAPQAEQVSPTTPAPSAPVVPPAPTQVFMGIVANGTLSNYPQFVERRDDLIESFDEFQIAAQQNLSSFVLGLTNRISYELKIVPSVVTSGGFRQTGTTNRYITGYNKDGTPKYKTITNKFATLTVYILNDKSTRTKIGTIVLGPVDASKISPTQTDLRQLEALIQNSIVTRNIDDISRIETSTPTTIVPPTGGTTEQENTTTPPPSGSALQVPIPQSQLSFFGGVIAEGASWSREEGVFIKRNGEFVREGDGAILVGV